MNEKPKIRYIQDLELDKIYEHIICISVFRKIETFENKYEEKKIGKRIIGCKPKRGLKKKH